MPKLAPPPPTNQDVASRQFRDWFYSVFQFINNQTGQLGTMAYENANSVAITGGSIGGVGISGSTVDATPIGSITPSTGRFTSLSFTVPIAISSGGTGASTAAGARTNLGLGSGLSVTITTAKLTPTGTNGSMTFTNGILTAQTQAT
jgi:hypothetical protein